MDPIQIGKMIRFHRKKSGLSQKELGKIAGLGKTAVFDIENGKRCVRINTLCRVLDILNIKMQFQSPLMHIFEGQYSLTELSNKEQSISKAALIEKLPVITRANVFVDGQLAGELQEIERGKRYRFVYSEDYSGMSVSLRMPRSQLIYEFDRFPSFFEGVLPEGILLEAFLKATKLDRDDLMGQLLHVGGDLVGNVTVQKVE